MNRRDQQLINKAELDQLRELAQDGQDMRAALTSLSTKRLEKMEAVRVGNSTGFGVDVPVARGWLEFESDLGDALLAIQRKRMGDDGMFTIEPCCADGGGTCDHDTDDPVPF
jgi:hypothetical protein